MMSLVAFIYYCKMDSAISMDPEISRQIWKYPLNERLEMVPSLKALLDFEIVYDSPLH